MSSTHPTATAPPVPFFVMLWSDDWEQSKEFFLHAADEQDACTKAVACADEDTAPEKTRWYPLRVIETANL